MTEQILFDRESVRVTSSRLVVGNDTYAINKINAVKTSEEEPGNLVVGVGFIAGIIAIFNSVIAGLVIFTLIGLFLYKRETTYHLEITTSSRDQTAFSTKDEQTMKDLVTAINMVISKVNQS